MSREEMAAFNRNLHEGIRTLNLHGVAETVGCVGGCALADVDIPAFLAQE